MTYSTCRLIGKLYSFLVTHLISFFSSGGVSQVIVRQDSLPAQVVLLGSAKGLFSSIELIPLIRLQGGAHSPCS